MGIHHFTSTDGIQWKRQLELVSSASIRPFIYHFNSRYYLYYEKVLQLWPSLHSRIEVRVSSDLKHWDDPLVILTPSLNWHREGGYAGTVGNPCVVLTDNGFRLYYSAGLVYLRDCCFYEPRHIGYANSTELTGDYVPQGMPCLSPDHTDPLANLAAGAIKVLPTKHGFVGFQNGIYWDDGTQHSGSAIRVLSSMDGFQWVPVSPDPILRPGHTWKQSHVYALDVRLTSKGWRMYFNARDGWWWGRERIGLMTGEPD